MSAPGIPEKKSLLGRSEKEIAALLSSVCREPYRARQVFQWIHDRRAASFSEMTNLPASLRSALAESFCVGLPAVVGRTPAEDGALKYLFELGDGARIEAVYISDGERTTICVSSQSGCAVDCKFCVTGRMGGGRNLTAGEIIGQYLAISREKGFGPREANVVFMGMGEPLLNVEAVNQALDLLFREVSPRRVTVSTSGIVPGIEALSAREIRPNLAVSLCAPDDAMRSRIMPINRAYPLDALMAVLGRWPLEKGRRLTFEYVLIQGLNDSVEIARRLARLVRPFPCKVNLIPLNESTEWLPGLNRSSDQTVDLFGRTLASLGVAVTVRWSKGLGADAACGQLKGRDVPRRSALVS
ncbi:MAG: Dual-specificity RNA methyltransferase RlmN [Thermoanaerobaculia bacterium]|nr:Dual-specificity RNA methyltransferase RlmN [Thermoanaerobaculia bacterium]